MSTFIQFMNASSTTWDNLLNNSTFKSLEMFQFECANFKGIEVIDWVELNIQDAANKARAGGVDVNNISGITSELKKGYRTTELPPIVVILPNGEKQLWDGYNRYNACYNLGIQNFPFLVYELKSEWENCVDDAYDIVSLSANNHTVAKRHTINDFINRGISYCKRHKSSLDKNQIEDWVNSIDHTFTHKQVETIVNGIYQRTTIAVNIIPYASSSGARAKFAKLVNTESADNKLLLCCKEEGYVNRTFLQIMQNYVNGMETEVAMYTKSCETAEAVMKQRKYAVERLRFLDKLVMDYVVKRISEKKESFEISGFLPQLNGIEDPQMLVPYTEE